MGAHCLREGLGKNGKWKIRGGDGPGQVLPLVSASAVMGEGSWGHRAAAADGFTWGVAWEREGLLWGFKPVQWPVLCPGHAGAGAGQQRQSPGCW